MRLQVQKVTIFRSFSQKLNEPPVPKTKTRRPEDYSSRDFKSRLASHLAARGISRQDLEEAVNRGENGMCPSETHMGTAFFVEGGRNFFMCTWVKNGCRGGDVFWLP